MRTIKVGATGTQSRVAQACDRCRTKKVRCDGNRPCCTQCARVGFECQTSDKLSRRSFPRGYTESLEDRVRALEAEVRDLKDLLDRKDEEIDVLSRRRPFSPQYQRMASSIAHSEGVIHVQPSSSQYTSPKSNSKPYTALSSTQGFVDVFTDRLVSEAELNSKLPTTSLAQRAAPVTHAFPNQALKIPSRFLTDQLINIFFQEWAPMYPVVHRSAILKAYELFLSNAESLEKDVAALAQLNLIFGIAALSSDSRTKQHPGFFEEKWAAPFDYLSSKTSVASVQCFILAQIYCMTKGECRRLLRYRAIAVDICHQLGLYHNGNGTAFNLLEAETRKKVFWCQYVLDRFCAALTGLPVLLNESDVQTEYPMDVDDENLSETDVLPTLPGQPTRISSALALFGASRILTKILEEIFPSRFDYVVHTSKMRSVADQLDEWLQNLPPHLRIEFIRDKPSMDIRGSRSPLLLLVYYFMRSLIHGPAVCFAEEHLRSSSILALSDCSKHIIQILELLDERRLCLSFSINRKELILVSGIGLLWQVLEVKPDRKLSEKTQNLLTTAIEQLKLESPAAAAELSAICNTLLSANTVKRGRTSTEKGSFNMSAATQKPSKSSKWQSLKSRLTGSANLEQLIAASSSQRSTISDATPPLALPSLLSPSWHTLPDSEDHVDRWHSSLDLGTDARQVSAFPSLGYYDPRAMPCPSSPDANTGAIVMADWENVVSETDQEYLEVFTSTNGGKGLSAGPGSFESIAAGHSRLSEDDTLAIPEQLIDLHDLSPEAWSEHAEGAELP